MSIASLKLTNVGPFDDIAFEFDRQVNVFTGPNNSGKSTALWVLRDILVPFSEFPRKLLGTDDATFQVGLLDAPEGRLTGRLPISVQDNGAYWDEKELRQYIDLVKRAGYTGFVPALRLNTDFRSPGPTISVNREDREHYPEELRNRRDTMETGASQVNDAVMIQKVIDLDYRSYRLNKPAFRDIVVKIGEMASEITEGFPVRFMRVYEDARGLFPQFSTPDGEVSLNVLSQGTQSIIQWLAHFLIGYAEYYEFPENLAEKPGILIVDEIDAHLHPSWQRRIIPTLTQHFPNLQIFCSTHSPLMLAGLKEGQVQLLRRDEKGKVTVSRNERDIIGWSADEIMRFLLEVRTPTDLETARHAERLQELRMKAELSVEEAEELEELRETVRQDLLNGPVSAQVDRMAEILRKARDDYAARQESNPAAAPSTSRRRRRPAK